MISGIRGKLVRLDVNYLFIEADRITYEIFISFKSYLELKEKLNSEIHLHVYHSITDRMQKLYGFLSYKDRELFKVMKSLDGIGEMTALKILSFLSANEIYQIAVSDEREKLEKIPKVKGKTSEKIIFEVKRNLKKFETFLNEGDDYTPSKEEKKDLSVLALMQLGFDEKTATKEVARIIKEKGLDDTAEIIKEALRGL
ncbi:MAG: Holliday junction branch migration protein RuvA [Leptospira sp.]|nr:Holliday junction branch migration protein RuvA [Leptospira sp.]